MADRSKKRRRRPAARRRAEVSEPASAEPVADEPRAAARSERADARREKEKGPPAPWGSFPLVELVVLVALVMLVVGFFLGGARGPTLIVTGLALGSLAGLELSIREHFAGYRSHTLLLASASALAVLAILYFGFPDDVSTVARIAAAAAVGVLSGLGLLRAFRRRTGRSVKLR